jgi:galactosylceramidase
MVSAATAITINGSGVGRTFEGIGAVSAGASSKLLVDYPEPYKSDILDYLFKPNFGAAFQHLKVEIGGGYNSTEGSEPSFARTSAEMSNPNFNRGYEYWLMQQAHSRNPNIYLDCLWWALPSWISQYSQDEANYLVKFIQGAKSQWGLDMNYIGGNRNEKTWDTTNGRNWVVNTLRPTLNSNGLSNVKIEISDEGVEYKWPEANQIVTDSALANAVNALASHYPKGVVTQNALNTGKPLWASEDFSEPGDWRYGFDFATEINRNYVNGKITKTEAWCPVDAFYDSLICSGTGVMKANTPWSGYYEVSPAVWCVAHTTQFAQPGWKYLDSGCGNLPGGGNNYYVTLKSPNSSDYSIIIANSNDNEMVTFNLTGGLSTGTVHVWTSNATSQFVHSQDITPVNGSFSINVVPGTIYSVTTTTGQQKGVAANSISANTAFPATCTDNFESYAVGATPKYFMDQNCTFEVAQISGESKSLRQVIPQGQIGEPWRNNFAPFTVIGDETWTDYTVAANCFIEDSGTVKVMGRINPQKCWNAYDPNGYVLSVSDTGSWNLVVNDTPGGGTQVQTDLASGTSSVRANSWHNLKLQFAGSNIKAFIDGIQVASVTDTTSWIGLAGLGTNWNTARFDNFQVTNASSGRIVAGATYKIQNINSGKVAQIDGSSIADGANVTQWDWLNGVQDNQKWIITSVGSINSSVTKH